MKRRTFIKTSLLGGIGTLLLGGLWVGGQDMEKRIISILKDTLQGMQWQESDLQSFAQDFIQEEGYTWKQSLRICLYASFYESFRQPIHLQNAHQRYQDFRHYITTTFLLSTNFISQQLDETKAIEYLGFYNPYLRPCSNPFSL